jgi:hypothetical protein
MSKPQTHAPSANELLRLALNDTGDNWMELHSLCGIRANAELFLRAIQSSSADTKGQLLQWLEAIRDLHPDLVSGVTNTGA